jgi:hypothetical protein
MIRSALPIMHLADLPAPKSTANRVSGLDLAFLFASAALVVGGCFFLLNLGAAQSASQESSALHFLRDAAVWLPALAKVAAKYTLLMFASVVNSALIVLLVQALRTLDTKLSHRQPKLQMRMRSVFPVESSRRTPAISVQRTSGVAKESGQYLLPMLFR